MQLNAANAFLDISWILKIMYVAIVSAEPIVQSVHQIHNANIVIQDFIQILRVRIANHVKFNTVLLVRIIPTVKIAQQDTIPLELLAIQLVLAIASYILEVLPKQVHVKFASQAISFSIVTVSNVLDVSFALFSFFVSLLV